MRASILFATAVCSAFLCSAPTAQARQDAVAAFFNPDIGPYRVALEGFKSTCGCAVLEFPVRSGERLDATTMRHAAAAEMLFAIGADAFAATMGVHDRPVLVTMVSDLRERIRECPNCLGIELALPPERHLETMRRLFPEAKRIGVLYDPRVSTDYLAEAQTAARELGFKLVPREMARPQDALERIEDLKGGIDVFWMLPEPVLAQPDVLNAIILFSFQNRVPVYSFARKYVAQGAVAALAVDPFDLGVQAGELTKALAGGGVNPKAPRRLYAREHDLYVNRGVVERLGLRLTAETLLGTTDVSR